MNNKQGGAIIGEEDFSNIDKFLASLKQFPIHNYFIHKKNAVDELNFRNLSSGTT